MSNIEFNAEKHEYILDGKKMISVTQILQKHGIAPSYDSVDKELLERSAERGTMIHEELENLVNNGQTGFTIESMIVDNKFKELGLTGRAEVRLTDGMIAGTADFIGKDKNGESYIIDFKTGSAKHAYAWSWQVALYEYLYGKKVDHKQVYFLNDGALRIIDLMDISKNSILDLLKAEKEGYIWGKDKIIDSNTTLHIAYLEREKAKIKAMMDEIDEEESQLKESVLNTLEEHNIKNYKHDGVSITYVAPSVRRTLDKKVIIKDFPNIDDDKYWKETKVNRSIRIKLEEGEN